MKPTQDHLPEHATAEEKDAFLRTIFTDPVNKWRGLIADVHGDFSEVELQQATTY